MDLKLFTDFVKAHFKIKFLAFHVESRFSSANADYRLAIRQDMVTNYSPLFSSFEKRGILNLDTLPVVENLFFSISHNKSIGGYAACDQKVGFDIEEISRLSSEAINRICSPEEVSRSPEMKLLWSAKEASLKVFKLDLLVTDFEILSWKKQDEFFHFEAECKKIAKSIQGLVMVQGEFVIACAFIK